ncbi:type I restriction enzyme HsdR N-terminal domain-containing protein [Geothrix fuzhouensis]|uniref:type I restriction enzyme HsdR N-terminal domain-containing protein n=1 Tax=Geothrix fuzhouensis TaxID=2966451 RepID=UPI00214847F1|nr:type I restriction enzyme HsdR N-terminal domain-containing protein [Geothrix fuzhouensis]
MTTNSDFTQIAKSIRLDVEESTRGAKRMRLKSLLAKFGHIKRSDNNTAEITRLLSSEGLCMNPPIVRFGESWDISIDTWIYLSCETPVETTPSPTLPTWNADGWFDKIAQMDLRTEKEVEIKFIVPLLHRLGYTDDDRYDGMPIPAAHGSRDTTLVIDFALFNVSNSDLLNQPILTVEAKREGRLSRQRELLSAHNQAKSYCLWTQCDFFMVTDSRTIQVFHIARGKLGELSPIFSSERSELLHRFSELYSVASKEALTNYYLKKLATTEEAY